MQQKTKNKAPFDTYECRRIIYEIEFTLHTHTHTAVAKMSSKENKFDENQWFIMYSLPFLVMDFHLNLGVCRTHLFLFRKMPTSIWFSEAWSTTVDSVRLRCISLRSSKCGAISKNSCSAHDGNLHELAKHNSQYGKPKWAMHMRWYSVNESAKYCHRLSANSYKKIFGVIDSSVS